jgi:hypothetical protein
MKRLALLIAGVALSVPLLQGCVLGLVAVGAGAAAAGVEYSQAGVASKTFTAPLNDVRTAAVKALGRMDLRLQDDAASPQGRKIVASANDRTVEINLENLTYNTTRMQVAVKWNASIIKDADTATEIVQQTSQVLQADTAPLPRPRAATR